MLILSCFFFLALLTSQSLIDLSTVLISVAAIIAIFKKKPVFQQDLKPYIFPLGGLFVVAFAGLARYLPESQAVNNILEFRWILELGFFVWCFSQVKDWTFLFKFMLAAVGASSILAIIFYFSGINPVLVLKESHQGVESLAEPRLGGFFGHSMPFAHTYSLAFLVASGYFLLNRKSLSKSWQIWGGLGLLCCFMALIFSYSRGIWLACVVAVFCTLVLSKNRSLFKATIVGVILGGIAFATVPNLQDRIATTAQQKVNGDNQRKVLYRANWLIFKDHPIVGIGYSYNRIKLREYYDRLGVPAGFFEGHAHNQYVQWLSGTGILGLACYLWFVFLMLFQNYKLFCKTELSPERGILLGTLMAQICFLIASLTEANFSIAKNRAMYLFVVALFLAIKIQQRQKGAIKN